MALWNWLRRSCEEYEAQAIVQEIANSLTMPI